MTTSDRVPEWVHLAEVPPTDDEPWTSAWERCDRHPHDDDRGLWLGWVLAALLFVLGFIAGRISS